MTLVTITLLLRVDLSIRIILTNEDYVVLELGVE